MRRLSRAAAILTLFTAQTGRPMTIRDLIVAVRVADPQISPNGQSVAFVRTTTDPASGKRNADIWIAPADQVGATKPLIAGDKSETTPRWSPDGRQLAFIATRDGDPQVYLAGADGSNVRKITDVSGGVQPPLVFSPDGTMVAFVADVYPECKDDACNRQRREAADKDPVKAHVITRLLYRHWDEWREGVRHHVFVAPVAGGPARDVTPGDFDSPPGQQEDNAIAFAPNSRLLAFVSNREGNDKEAWTTNNDVWLVPVTGGDAKKLTGNPAADNQPTFTPDGKIHDRPRAAAAGLRVRSLLSRRLRPRDGREAHALRDAGPVGERLHALRREDDLLHRARTTARTICTESASRAATPEEVRHGGGISSPTAASGRLAYLDVHDDLAGRRAHPHASRERSDTSR